MKPEVNLQLGTRYWLDRRKDVSGLYAGTNSNGSQMFLEVRGVPRFLQDSDGSVSFAGSPTDFYVYQKEDESEESSIRTV